MLSPEAQALFAAEEKLATVFRLLVAEAARPGPIRRDLLNLAATIQALQAKALAEARRR